MYSSGALGKELIDLSQLLSVQRRKFVGYPLPMCRCHAILLKYSIQVKYAEIG
jgi:hypothetical protein